MKKENDDEMKMKVYFVCERVEYNNEEVDNDEKVSE